MKKVVSFVACAALLVSAWPAAAQSRYGSTVVGQDCIGDRCVIRDRHGRRLGTVTTESTGRLAVRDRRGNLVAKVTPEGARWRVQSRR